MYILGISCFYHESSAVLIKDGKIIAASAEERFSRIKHDNAFPKKAIDFCLQQEGISIKDISYVVFYEKPFLKFERIITQAFSYFPYTLRFFITAVKYLLGEKFWIKSIIAQKTGISLSKILFVPHHLSHAASAFYPSLFERAAFLTIDGAGEWTTSCWGVAEKNRLFPKQEMQFPNSIGLFYATCTAFLGFEVNDGEYKVMGMAGYGKPKYLSKVKKLYKQYKDGSVILDLSYFAFQKSTTSMYAKKFEKEFAGCDRFDLAASFQKATEEMLLALAKAVKKKTKEKYLVIGGGVGLNSVANALIAKKSGFADIFIFPASGDDGGAAGAALYVYHHVLGFDRKPLQDVFLGKSYKKQDIEKFLHAKKIHFVKKQTKTLTAYIASKLAQGKVIGWFEGRAEFGPRALGHRSILADPRKKEMKEIVNARIKFREEFRPFAPVILAEYKAGYFADINDNLAQFMLGTFQATDKTRKQAPAIVHVDKTSRIQLVAKNFSGMYRQVIEKFYKKTGVPILLNTSFNLKGEPIVNSPQDAYSTFIRSGIDILVLENYVLEK